MTPQEFFDTANRLMETDPPAEADAPLLRSLAALSVGPGQQFDASALGPLGGLRWKRLLLQLKSSLRAQAARYSRQMGQWIYYGDPIGNFGTAYDYRTMVALMGLGANTTDIAIYPRKSKFSPTSESIANQVAMCREYCDRCFDDPHYLVYDEDEGFSGKSTNRPAFTQMIEDMRAGKFQVLC